MVLNLRKLRRYPHDRKSSCMFLGHAFETFYKKYGPRIVWGMFFLRLRFFDFNMDRHPFILLGVTYLPHGFLVFPIVSLGFPSFSLLLFSCRKEETAKQKKCIARKHKSRKAESHESKRNPPNVKRKIQNKCVPRNQWRADTTKNSTH